MKLALISLMKESPFGENLVGLLPLFDRTIIENQVAAVENIGAEAILFLSGTMSSELLQYADSLNQRGIATEIIRTGQELASHASEDDQIVFLGDGILPDFVFEEKLASQTEESIYVVGNADEYSNFERIDLTHRWLGTAILNASRLSELTEIPDDWDIGSALLRTAVQSEVRRDVMSDEQVASGAIVHLNSESAIQHYTKKKLHDPTLRKGNFVNRFLMWPLMRRSLKPLWKLKNSRKYLGGMALASGLLAGAAAALQWPVFSLGLLVFGCVITTQNKVLEIFAPQKRGLFSFEHIFEVICQIVLLALVLLLSGTTSVFANIVISVTLLMLLLLEKYYNNISKIDLFRPNLMLVLLIMFAAASMGQLFAGLYAALIWTTAYLLSDQLILHQTAKKQQKTGS